jgi:hypothetical protein
MGENTVPNRTETPIIFGFSGRPAAPPLVAGAQDWL